MITRGFFSNGSFLNTLKRKICEGKMQEENLDNILTYTGSKFLKQKITVNLEDGTRERESDFTHEPILLRKFLSFNFFFKS